MAKDPVDARTTYSTASHTKLARLPSNYKVSKRPLLRPPIPSPYASASAQKVVYISHRTPFMSAVQRVRHLLKQVEKRETQSLMATAGRGRGRGGRAAGDRILAAAIAGAEQRRAGTSEEILIKGTGKAIERVLGLAEFFKNSGEANVVLRTGSVFAVDDVLMKTQDEIEREHARRGDVEHPPGEAMELEPRDVPDARLRQTSMLEVGISLR